MTDEIQKVAKARLGREITLRELRLMPYIDHCLKNDHRIEVWKINDEERRIMSAWRKNGWLEDGASADSLAVTKEFYDTIQEILWIGYVTCD